MKKLETVLLVLLAILSAAVAAVYFSKTAGSLPHFFLGYIHGSNHKHLKHGIAFAALAVVFLLAAWMIGGQSADDGASAKQEDEKS